MQTDWKENSANNGAYINTPIEHIRTYGRWAIVYLLRRLLFIVTVRLWEIKNRTDTCARVNALGTCVGLAAAGSRRESKDYVSDRRTYVFGPVCRADDSNTKHTRAVSCFKTMKRG